MTRLDLVRCAAALAFAAITPAAMADKMDNTANTPVQSAPTQQNSMQGYDTGSASTGTSGSGMQSGSSSLGSQNTGAVNSSGNSSRIYGGGPSNVGRSSNGSVQQGSTGAQEVQGGQQPITSTVRVNRQFSFQTMNNCTYSATVRGTIRPASTAANVGDSNQQGLLPNLVVGAMLQCPNEQAVQINDVPISTPISRAELVHRIALRASVLKDTAGVRCAFVPEIQLSQQGLIATGVSYLCPAPGNAQGGGPNFNMNQP